MKETKKRQEKYRDKEAVLLLLPNRVLITIGKCLEVKSLKQKENYFIKQEPI
jgi:hypothetical protein